MESLISNDTFMIWSQDLRISYNGTLGAVDGRHNKQAFSLSLSLRPVLDVLLIVKVGSDWPAVRSAAWAVTQTYRVI